MLPDRRLHVLGQDHVQISEIYGLGGEWGIDSKEHGARFWIEEWGYPDIGVVVCECPSAGHDAIMLDYSKCGRRGEPSVVHVEVEADEPKITFLAKDFGTFLLGLVNAEEFSTEAEDLATDRGRVRAGRMTPLLDELCSKMAALPDAERLLRSVAAAKVEECGHFALHDDPISTLMYDLQFWLYTNARRVESAEKYLEAYPGMLVFGGRLPNGEAVGFCTGGYGPGFVEEWLRGRLKKRAIQGTRTKQLRFTDSFIRALEARALEFLAPSSVRAAKKKARPAPRQARPRGRRGERRSR